MNTSKRKQRRKATQTRASSSGGIGTIYRNQRRQILAIPLLLAGGIAGGTMIHNYDVNQKALHDLSVIGQGKPVVVQVHDPSCPSCRQLKRATEKAMTSLPGLHYRIADLGKEPGRRLANEHNAGKVTLLLFRADGRRTGRIEGVHSAQELISALSSHFVEQSGQH